MDEVEGHSLTSTRISLSAIAKQFRWHQWVKNALVFLPLILAHRVTDTALWLHALTSFVSFSALASMVYVLNDIVDIEHDRAHPTKRHRPLVSGAITLPYAYGGVVLLAGIWLSTCSWLPKSFFLVTVFYLTLNVAYSMALKRMVILDVVTLAIFYNLRILAGGLATEVPVSSWLMAFSTFFFFGLAMVKRFTELLRHPGGTTKRGRAYQPEDIEIIRSLGVGSSLLSVLVLTLYFNSPEVRVLYRRYEALWLLTPLLVYWIARLWVLAQRDDMHDDPIVWAVRDPSTWITGAAVLAVLYAAS